MIGKDKVQVFASIPKELKAELLALRKLDHVLFSESRVIWQCLEAHLPVIKARIMKGRTP